MRWHLERPVLAVDREVPPEIEQGVLAHLAVNAPALDQTQGDTGGAVSCGSGFGLANEHGAILRRGMQRARRSRTIMALQTPNVKKQTIYDLYRPDYDTYGVFVGEFFSEGDLITTS